MNVYQGCVASTAIAVGICRGDQGGVTYVICFAYVACCFVLFFLERSDIYVLVAYCMRFMEGGGALGASRTTLASCLGCFA